MAQNLKILLNIHGKLDLRNEVKPYIFQFIHKNNSKQNKNEIWKISYFNE